MSKREPIKISTGAYNTQGKVDVDGHIWTVKLPGTGTELKLSQAFRLMNLYGARLQNIQKKIDDVSATDEELDQYEKYSEKMGELENTFIDIFTSLFNDGTPNNDSVRAWVDQTPQSIMLMALDSIKEQANEVPDGKKTDETTTS